MTSHYTRLHNMLSKGLGTAFEHLLRALTMAFMVTALGSCVKWPSVSSTKMDNILTDTNSSLSGGKYFKMNQVKRWWVGGRKGPLCRKHPTKKGSEGGKERKGKRDPPSLG